MEADAREPFQMRIFPPCESPSHASSSPPVSIRKWPVKQGIKRGRKKMMVARGMGKKSARN